MSNRLDRDGAATTTQSNGSGLASPHPRKPILNRSLAHALANDGVRPPTRSSTPVPRMFPSVDYQNRLSYFDPNSDWGNFRGFFVLFWVGLAIMVITAMLRNLRETGYLLQFRQWPLFTANLWELAVVDMAMCGSTILDLPLHLLYKSSRGWLRWDKGGVIVQSLFQLGWLALWISWPFMRRWTWTAQVFLTLHTLALFMKLHSYAFYNGHLSTTLNRLKELDQPIGPATPMDEAVRYPTAHHPQHLGEDPQEEKEEQHKEHHHHLSPVYQLRSDLAQEITSPMGNVTYPANLTLPNFFDYLLVPTLCYELEYPRVPTRSYQELFWKTLAVFGCVFLMTVTSEEFILPVLSASQIRLAHTTNYVDAALIFAEPIFEYVLGAFAEITRFADRQFYSDWWNSLDWASFARQWNIPVHNFFRRHVYSASRTAKMSKPAAMAVTFFISALAHELVMGCITRKFRGYGFVLMMLQIPLMAVQRLPGVRERVVVMNVCFWIFMILGLSLLCALYVLL
ncbi:putative sterol O-acyltransferase 2 [Teratosphaeria destructans]|uniref:O-acyltransferase n=1 Tax=Teratosphaeria destructans TaxID=418781 RepID=A0A9W7SUU8_9PEZI|nr:putative sterol O-acyltransferase 2 [Teratosphaeria destructans]